MKKITTIVLFQVLATCLFAQKNNQTLVCENKYLKVVLRCEDTASMDQPDWLTLVIENKTPHPISIDDAGYSVFREGTDGYNVRQRKFGFRTEMNKYQLFCQYYNGSSTPNIEIAPYSKLSSWKYLTNHASLMECKRQQGREICANFQLRLTFSSKDVAETVEVGDTKFCFYWTPDTLVEQAKLVHRLKTLLNDVHVGNLNHYVTKHLMNKPQIVGQVSTNELVNAVLRVEDRSNETTMLFLTALKDSGRVPDERLTARYRNDLKNNYSKFTKELEYYWDNTLLDDLLASNLDVGTVAHILDVNGKSWSFSPENRAKVYRYLASKIPFEQALPTTNTQFETWTRLIDLMVISRSEKIIDYLVPLLDNEQVFLVKDFSKYSLYGRIPQNPVPDTHKVRLCDAAYERLSKAMDRPLIRRGNVVFRKKSVVEMSPEDKQKILAEVSLRKKTKLYHQAKLYLFALAGLFIVFLLYKNRSAFYRSQSY